MVKWLEQLFPKLRGAQYRITSPADGEYNCVAWAVDVTHAWWWPVGIHPDIYWPADVLREETLAAFQSLFSKFGYALCAGAELEKGFEKVALFGDTQGVPTHVARQLPSGRWTSKLGHAEDIEHDLDALESDLYGAVVFPMKRASDAPEAQS
jgi:hypothetical protein